MAYCIQIGLPEADLYIIDHSFGAFQDGAIPKVGIGTQEMEIHNPHAGASSTSSSVGAVQPMWE